MTHYRAIAVVLATFMPGASLLAYGTPAPGLLFAAGAFMAMAAWAMDAQANDQTHTQEDST